MTPLAWFRGLPSPVWSLALWCGLFAVSITEAALHNADLRTAVILGGLSLEIGLMAVIWGARAPRWFLHGCVVLMLVVTFVAAGRAPNDVQMLSGATGAMAAVLYAGLWWYGPSTYVYAALGSAGYLLTLGLTGHRDQLMDSWVALTALLVGTAIVLNVVMVRTVYRSVHDPVTGLLNRVGLDRYLAIHSTAGRAALPRTLVLLDLDGFKSVNDTHGHAVGDAVLRRLGEVLVRELRPDDTAFRVGGDEFLLVLPQTASVAAGPLLERLRSGSPIAWSAGVVDWPADASFDAVMAAADRAMYADKCLRALAT